jgi:hypothetical protein
METSKRDELLGTITWWGFHALLMWLGAEHFLAGPPSDGRISTSDLFAGSLMGATLLSLLRLSAGRHLLRFIALIGVFHELYQVWQGAFQWGSLTYVAIWVYTFYSFGPNSWRHALYTPLGVFGTMKTKT